LSPLKIALVGCGGIAAKHAHHLMTIPDQVEMVSFMDPSLDKAVQMAQKYGSRTSRVYTDYSEMIETGKPDAVVIAIPPFAHTDQVKIAAHRGIHIFIEKPVALTTEKAWEMVADVERAGIKTQVGFMYRFGAAVEKWKQLIESGKTGPIGLVTARYFCNSLHSEWWRRRALSGGQIFEQAIHLVDLMRYLAGEAATVYSLQNNVFHRHVPDYTVEDVSGTIFGFKNGGVGVLNATKGAIPNRWGDDLRIVAQKVTAQLDSANQGILTYTDQENLPTEVISSEKDVYAEEMDEFIKAILENGTTRTSLREGALTLEMVAAANRSSQTHAEERV
jgi:predicted dehydrogenase